MYTRRDAEANRDRLYSEGTPFSETFRDFEACDSMVTATFTLLNECRNHSPRNCRLEAKLANSEELFDAALPFLGLSKEQLRAFVLKLEMNEFGKDTAAIKRLVKYDSWVSYGPITRMSDYNRRYGLATFALNAAHKFPNLKKYAWCDYKRICDNQTASRSMVECLVYQRLQGSFAAKRGNQKQTLLQTFLMSLGIKTKTKGLVGSYSTYDLISDRFAAEVSYPEATGSGQSQKSSRMASESEAIRASKGKDFKLMYIGGGMGLLPRRKDVQKLVTTMDYCFGRTKEQAVEFGHCASIIHDLKHTKDYVADELDNVMEAHAA